MIDEYDYVVVGGGIAGASTAAHLPLGSRVCLIEMEEQPGYHSTGRSAALFSEGYGNDVIRALTRASRTELFEPADGFSTSPLVHPRAVMGIAHEGQEETLSAFIEASKGTERLRAVSPEEAVRICPILRPEVVVGAAIGDRTAEIEVHELHQAYLRNFREKGGVVRLSAKVTGLSRDRGGWRIATPTGELWGEVVINAAGAWAAEIGLLAGAKDILLRPLKRTACLVPAPEGMVIDKWPLVVDVEEAFYLKPDAGLLLLSPADETLSAPCDAQADELDLAIAIDRVERSTTLQVRRISHRWAGLRSFVPDSSPVVGFDPVAPNFFWVAALGGYGIQTAPAIGRIAGRLATRRDVASAILDYGVNLASIAPDREYQIPDAGHRIGVTRDTDVWQSSAV